MTVEVVPLDAVDWGEWRGVHSRAFGYAATDEALATPRPDVERHRAVAAVEDGVVVGGAQARTLEVTVPGGGVAPVAGVAGVGVLATARRKGVLRRMLGALHDDARARREVAAVLWAAEAGIYGRFGYGPAMPDAAFTVDARAAAFAPPPVVEGRFRFVPAAESSALLPAVFDGWRRRRPGNVARTPGMWARRLDPDGDGRSAQHVVHESPDGVDGFVSYRVEPHWEGLLRPGHTLVVEDLCGAGDDVEAALWLFCLDVDLVTTVVARHRPPEEPVWWRLTDLRHRRVTELGDGLWARVFDVPGALSARTYLTEGRLVVEVVGAGRDGEVARVELEGGPDGAACRRTTASPDLTLGEAELGAVWLGGTSPSTLAAAGRVDEHTPGALGRADAMLAAVPAPHCATFF